ncbi:hypothetical protein ATANTOWER_026869, partial [Ataeniobius toweri]|nr:hypothetical protein [Ataeniobius toweri]
MKSTGASSHHALRKETGPVSQRWMCLGVKCENQAQNKSKWPCEDADFSWKRVSLKSPGLKGHSERKKSLLPEQRKNSDYSLQMQKVTNALIFGGILLQETRLRFTKKKDDLMRRKHYVGILKQDLKTS